MDLTLSAAQQAVLGTIFIPVFVAMFKGEISSFFSDLGVYKNRQYDDDGDPGTGQDCYLQCGATGVFSKITVKEYKFGLLPQNRKVITLQPSPDPDQPDKVIVVPYSYADWKALVKGSLEKSRSLALKGTQPRYVGK